MKQVQLRDLQFLPYFRTTPQLGENTTVTLWGRHDEVRSYLLEKISNQRIVERMLEPIRPKVARVDPSINYNFVVRAFTWIGSKTPKACKTIVFDFDKKYQYILIKCVEEGAEILCELNTKSLEPKYIESRINEFGFSWLDDNLSRAFTINDGDWIEANTLAYGQLCKVEKGGITLYMQRQ